MTNAEHQAVTEEFEAQASSGEKEDHWALIILWSAREPERVGEVALLEAGPAPWILGRCPDVPQSALSNATQQSLTERPVAFFRQRPAAVPGGTSPDAGSPFLLGTGISRRQLEILSTADGLQIRNIGRCPLLINGQLVSAGLAPLGATIHLKDQLLLYCTRRPWKLPSISYYPARYIRGFGEADAFGVVGESPAVWNLRDRAALLAQGLSNVLIIGESGTGKELAAHIIHGLSARSGKQLVSINIAAIAPGLATVQLFGNRKGFPETQMPESKGLVGAADGACLFLDEIGDMPIEVQPMFLRVTDEAREYHRLGEEDRPPRRSDFRLIGATNRPEQLRIELKRRFPRMLQIPTLQDRREDIPLVVRHVLGLLRSKGDFEVQRFFVGQQVQVHPLLIEYLVHHCYKTHVAEISTLLGQAMAGSRNGRIEPCSTWSISPSHPSGNLPAAYPSQPSILATPYPVSPSVPAGASATPDLAADLQAGRGVAETVRVLLGRIKELSESEKQTLRNLIEESYERCRGDHKKTAALLGLDRYRLYRLFRRLGWQPVRSMSLNAPMPGLDASSDE